MTLYINVRNNVLDGVSNSDNSKYWTDDYFQVEITPELYKAYTETPNKFIWDGEKVVENSMYGDIVRAQKEYRRNHLTMTALDFIEVLKTIGLTSQEIEDYLNKNIDLKHQLQFCQNVYCGVVRQLLPLEVAGKTITDEIVVAAFEAKNVGNV